MLGLLRADSVTSRSIQGGSQNGAADRAACLFSVFGRLYKLHCTALCCRHSSAYTRNPCIASTWGPLEGLSSLQTYRLAYIKCCSTSGLHIHDITAFNMAESLRMDDRILRLLVPENEKVWGAGSLRPRHRLRPWATHLQLQTSLICLQGSRVVAMHFPLLFVSTGVC
jgi:hypothetical protein